MYITNATTPPSGAARYTTIAYANDQEVEMYASTRHELAQRVADDFLMRTEVGEPEPLTTYAVRDFINQTLDSGECLDITRHWLDHTLYTMSTPDAELKIEGSSAAIAWVLELALQQDTTGYIMPTRFHHPLD